MGARGKIRRRANGEFASGKAKQKPREFAPLMLDFDDTPVAAVPPSDLAEAVTIRNSHVPIFLPDVQEIEKSEGIDGLDEREQRIDREIEDRFGKELGDAVSWRASLLCRILTRQDPRYHEILPDESVRVDDELLEHAASVPVRIYPDEELSWPVKPVEEVRA